MKKFLVIAPYQYQPYFSGGQKSIAQFLDHFGNETDLTVVSVPENDPSLIKTYKHVALLKSSSARYLDLSLISKFISLIKKEKFDAVIWEHPYYAWLASIIKKRTGIKTILHIHNIEYQRFQSTKKWWWWILKEYEKWFFKKADKILFVSPEDKRFAIETWKIKEEKCIEVAFGVEISEYPLDKEKKRQMIKAKHEISSDDKILLFNGLLDYKPNLDALRIILKQINPILFQHSGFKYKIIICGKRLPSELNELKDYADRNIIYAGFVDDIEMYFKGVDLFLNTVQTGGGIKTKMVESIAFGTTVITTETGAIGIHRNFCGKKLVVVPDNDWPGFSKAIIENVDKVEVTPLSYYQYYYWGNIVKKVIEL
ncbi:MAG TPA: glycosyltransferase family 4 protein [Chitinophagaceae bacterium]|nr:glycosyltransferase family 4 protein [Chitinophagaceae bacterium]